MSPLEYYYAYSVPVDLSQCILSFRVFLEKPLISTRNKQV